MTLEVKKIIKRNFKKFENLEWMELSNDDKTSQIYDFCYTEISGSSSPRDGKEFQYLVSKIFKYLDSAVPLFGRKNIMFYMEGYCFDLSFNKKANAKLLTLEVNFKKDDIYYDIVQILRDYDISVDDLKDLINDWDKYSMMKELKR